MLSFRSPCPPLLSVYRFPTICSEAVCPHTAYQIVVARRRHRLLSAQYWVRLLRKVLGRYQYHPILSSIGQYPIPQYRYRSNPTGYHFSGLRSCSHSRSGQVPKENLWDNWSNFHRPDTLKKKKALTVAWPHLLSSTARPLIERCSLSKMSHTICNIDVNS